MYIENGEHYWTTKDGNHVKYKDIENSHLLYILKWIERKAEIGITVKSGGGYDDLDMWYDEYEIKDYEVFEYYDYMGLMKEFRGRSHSN